MKTKEEILESKSALYAAMFGRHYSTQKICEAMQEYADQQTAEKEKEIQSLKAEIVRLKGNPVDDNPASLGDGVAS